ncbi:MAG: transglutaminase-like domain-containing protein [Spirochaetia bacterium]
MSPLSRGEYVRLPGPVLGQHVCGEVRRSWREQGATYVRLYSYAAREEQLYTIDQKGVARRPVAQRPAAPDPTPAAGDSALAAATTDEARNVERPDETPPEEMPPVEHRHESSARWLGVVAGLLLLLLPLVTGGVAQLRTAGMSFDEFLATDMSLERMVSTVAARVSYERDVEEFWSPAEGVWAMRGGDCEDYAMIVSAYLERHGVEHTVVGFSLADSLAGHAAVIARTDDARVLIDPTMATAPTGIRYFRRTGDGDIPSRAAVLEDYARLPAVAYDPPLEPGRPAVSGFIE